MLFRSIAHRLSTISMADRIIVLDKGDVVQDGSFSELSVIEGHFREMWNHQNIEISGIVNHQNISRYENI